MKSGRGAAARWPPEPTAGWAAPNRSSSLPVPLLAEAGRPRRAMEAPIPEEAAAEAVDAPVQRGIRKRSQTVQIEHSVHILTNQPPTQREITNNKGG